MWKSSQVGFKNMTGMVVNKAFSTDLPPGDLQANQVIEPSTPLAHTLIYSYLSLFLFTFLLFILTFYTYSDHLLDNQTMSYN